MKVRILWPFFLRVADGSIQSSKHRNGIEGSDFVAFLHEGCRQVRSILLKIGMGFESSDFVASLHEGCWQRFIIFLNGIEGLDFMTFLHECCCMVGSIFLNIGMGMKVGFCDLYS